MKWIISSTMPFWAAWKIEFGVSEVDAILFVVFEDIDAMET